MQETNHKIRIKDIAILAGVSEGTVDRVLHNRGDVSAKSREAVTKVLEEMNYSPNLFARSLASKKQYRFVCLFPAHQPGNYWEDVDKGFDSAAHEFLHHNVQIEKQYFNQYDTQSYVNVWNSILKNEPDAVFIAPIFREETLAFTQELTKRHIPYSFIDSLIEEADFVTYYGQNSFKSGYIAAKLLLSSLEEGSQIIVGRTQRKGSVSNQTVIRHRGFMQYIQDHNLGDRHEIINVEFNNEDEKANKELLRNVFSTYKNIKGAITFNSKVYRLAMHLDALNHTNIRLIGYDLLQQNVTYLQQGVINYLIAQRPDKQAYYSVRDMCRELIFRQEIKKINYVPIDILMKENIEDYLQFTE
ncbi:MAG: LacI family DNA-binding transcriptional regulator [Paludibacter sp.]|nr:LacI family DNA-binding transcriptional regulator [Paludibacter sp.]